MIDDWARAAERRRPWARRAVWTVLLAGLLAFVVRGADEPADPYLAASGRRPLPGFAEAAVHVRGVGGTVGDWCALLAATEQARAQGLMGRTDLAGYDAMVFRFDGPTAARFYMYRTVMPLSIAWFDEHGAFVSAADMDPCPADVPGDCPTFTAAGDYVHAVEVPRGDLARLGIGPGSTIEVTEGRCPA